MQVQISISANWLGSQDNSKKHCVVDKSEKLLQSSRSPWEIRHRQGSRFKMDGISTMNSAATIVTTKSGYLLQENVK